MSNTVGIAPGTATVVVDTVGAPEDYLDEAYATLSARGEHVIFVLMQSTGLAAIPIGWRHTPQDARDTVKQLLAATPAGERKPYIWIFPVSDAIELAK